MITVPALAKRATNGGPLNSSQVDANFTLLQNALNSVFGLLGASLNPDGTLKDGAANRAAVLGNRIVDSSNLKFTALPVFPDEGGANNYYITPDPAATAYVDNMVFIVLAGSDNTGSSTLNVNGLGAMPIRKQGGFDLDKGDVKAGGAFMVVYQGGVFRLVGGIGSGDSFSINATGASGGIVLFQPADQGVPADAGNVAFNHGLGQPPTDYTLSLICINAEAGFNAGDTVPVSDIVVDGAGTPAFTVVVNNAQIVLTRHAATLNSGNAAALTDANWNVRAIATAAYAASVNMFPALTVSVTEPQGALSYGQWLFWMQYGQNAGKTYTQRLDMTTNGVKALGQPSDGSVPRYANMALFRRADGKDYAVLTTSTGVFQLALQDPGGAWQPTELFAKNGSYEYKPVWLVEAGGAITDIYAGGSEGNVSSAHAVKLRHINGATEATYGTNLDLTDANILNADGSAGNTEFRSWHPTGSGADILLFQYNPISKRLYVVTNETGLLHVFQLQTVSNDFKAWWDQVVATRAGNLKYLKSLSLAGGGGAWSDIRVEQMCVEYDTVTGLERAITWTRLGTASRSGTITRVPWRES